jgi:hypothetical protein
VVVARVRQAAGRAPGEGVRDQLHGSCGAFGTPTSCFQSWPSWHALMQRWRATSPLQSVLAAGGCGELRDDLSLG